MDYLSTIRKAIVPLIVAGVLALLGNLGITGSMSVEQVVTFVVTAVAVYLVPNKKG